MMMVVMFMMMGFQDADGASCFKNSILVQSLYDDRASVSVFD